MLKNILAVIGAVTVAAVAYVAFSDHVIVKIEPDEKYPEAPEEPEEPKEVAKPSEPKKEDHKLTFDELVRKMDESSRCLRLVILRLLPQAASPATADRVSGPNIKQAQM